VGKDRNKRLRVFSLLSLSLLCLSARQNTGYLQPGACAECHQKIAESYARTAMARTFGAVPADLKNGGLWHNASQEFFTVYARGGRSYVRRYQIGFDGNKTTLFEARLDYWIGSGNHARSYISRTKTGALIELPITWYAEDGGHWAMSPGYDRPDHAGFSRRINYRCMSCHNSFVRSDPHAGEDAGEESSRFADQLPKGIDCQRCHGPGQAHLEAVRRGAPADSVRSAIINPARLSHDRQMDVCLQCHLETTSLKLPAALLRYGRSPFSYLPGEPLADYALYFERAEGREDGRFEFTSAAYRLRKSDCYQKSGGRLTCVTCHNPHEPSNTPAAQQRFSEACLSCHANALRQLVVVRRHPVAQDCISCHMPKRRPSDAVHTTVTDHWIQSRPASDPTGPLVERHDGNTPPYRGRVLRYYPLNQKPEDALYEALAQVKHDANLEQGLSELENAVTRFSPSRSEFYFELAEANRRAGHLERAITFYEQSCVRRPEHWRYFYQLGVTLTTLGKTERAAAALQRALSMAPAEPVVLEAIANLLWRQGQLQESVTTLRAGLQSDPESSSIYSNLGARLFQLNDLKGAERSWREAVRLRPESAAMRLNLANLLATNGSFEEARSHFEAAMRSAPSFADSHLAYAIALASHGEAAQAEHHLREAIRHEPDNFEAHLRLGRMLRERGDSAGAAPHLRKAAESPDARIRDAAKQRP
jgi:predicted CXXCH cytochrome family protein